MIHTHHNNKSKARMFEESINFNQHQRHDKTSLLADSRDYSRAKTGSVPVPSLYAI